MPKLNLSVNISTYSDKKPSNSPGLSNFKWNRSINGIAAENPTSIAATLDASEVREMFTGAVVKFMYLETNQPVNVSINGDAPIELKPIVINSSTFPGVLLLTSDINSLEITNPSTTAEASIFLATVE